MRRRLLQLLLLAVVLVVLLVAAGLGAAHWTRQSLLEARDARIEVLDAELAAAGDPDELSPELACAIVEREVLGREVSRGLTAWCRPGAFESRGPTVAKLSIRYTWRVDQVLLGGSMGDTVCLARAEEGWTIAGKAHLLEDCNLPELRGPAEELADLALLQVAQARAARLREVEEAVRAALVDATPTPAVCTDLAPTTPRQLGVVDARVLAGDLEAGREVNFTSLDFRTCHGEAPEGCGGDDWRYVLVLDQVRAAPPVRVDAHRFTDGSYTATLKLVDPAARKVRCAGPVAYQLEVATAEAYDFSRGVGEAVCEAVGELTAGQVAMDPYWGCD